MRAVLVDRRRIKATSTTLELSRHRYALTPRTPVTRNDKEKKLVMVDRTSILGVGQFSIRHLGLYGSHHPHSTVYPPSEDRGEGGEREDESHDLACE